MLAPTITGLTVVSEKPVYIEKNWNANGMFAGAHAAIGAEDVEENAGIFFHGFDDLARL